MKINLFVYCATSGQEKTAPALWVPGCPDSAFGAPTKTLKIILTNIILQMMILYSGIPIFIMTKTAPYVQIKIVFMCSHTLHSVCLYITNKQERVESLCITGKHIYVHTTIYARTCARTHVTSCFFICSVCKLKRTLIFYPFATTNNWKFILLMSNKHCRWGDLLFSILILLFFNKYIQTIINNSKTTQYTGNKKIYAKSAFYLSTSLQK